MHVKRKLTKDAWCWARDVGETSIWMRVAPHDGKITILIIIFTDDFRVAAPRALVIATLVRLHELFGFSEESRRTPLDGEFIGMQREELQAPPGFRKARIHQTRYTQLAVLRVEKTIGCKLKEIKVPAKAKPDGNDEQLRLMPPKYREEAPEWTGVGFWVARGSRPECAKAVGRFSRRLHKWTAEEDALVLDFFGFLKKHASMGLLFVVWLEDVHRGSLIQKGWADSDLAGDPETTRSTSGWCVALVGQKTWALLDWGSRYQGATEPSTPGAELQALCDLITRSSAILNTFLRALYRRAVHEKLMSDNSAAVSVVRAGYPRRLAYMRRSQKLSLGLVADYVADTNTELIQVESAHNLADMFTKSLDNDTFWRLCAYLGIGTGCT